jgi:polyisoprenoid-binding protein YceI
MISTITGHINKFDATVDADKEDLSNAKIHFEADMDSVTTHNEQRDGHLKSPDFFDTANHPKLNFESTSFTKKDGHNYVLEGNLTMRGKTLPVKLDVEYAGKMMDPYGNEKHGFEINGKLNRKDYGLNWGAVTEAGGVMVSDEVKIHASVQFAKVK